MTRYPGRETFIVPVSWEDDWPIFNHGQKIRGSLPDSAPENAVSDLKTPQWLDQFYQPHMTLGWYRKSETSKAATWSRLC
jgi:beta-xylosidase